VGHAKSGVNASRPNAALSRTLPVAFQAALNSQKSLPERRAHDYLRAVEQRIAFDSMTTVAADQALAAYNAVARLTGRDFASEAEGI
jgi:hypothetical protein